MAGPVEFFQVWAWERRITRIKRRLRKLRDEKQEIYVRLEQIEDLELALNGRWGELSHRIELSGVYDDDF